MKRHLVVPYPASNASVRARGLHWIARLMAGGEIEQGDVHVHGPGFRSRSIAGGEPVLLMRNASRFSRGRTEARLLRRATPGVYDLDDGLPWDDGTLPRLGRWWKRPFPRSLIARRAATSADRVIAGNELLADWASQHCAEVVIVPTCVEPDEYGTASASLHDPPLIGWIGSPATEPYLFDIVDALVEVNRRTGALLELVSGKGATPPAIASFTRRRMWEPGATKWIAGWDIGLMPLRDGVYERAKCGYKLLQYAASCLPAVASPVGVNRQVLQRAGGLGAGDTAEWVEAIGVLLGESVDDRARRMRQSGAVAAEYSYATWQSTWLRAAGW